VIQIFVTDALKFRIGSHAPHCVKKCARGLHTFADEVQEFLDPVDVRRLPHVRPVHGLVEIEDVLLHISSCRHEDGLPAPEIPDLREHPRIADHAAPDHQSPRARVAKDLDACRG
jgi:hypothetical protein